MRELAPDADFWQALDQLVGSSEIVIDRPKNSAHPRYPDMLYPLDYGYLANTAAMDQAGVDVWIGSLPDRQVVGIVATVDLFKRDTEIKILLGCDDEEIVTIEAFLNQGSQRGKVIYR